MAAGKDKMGRPVVVVTGLGVVTSLGAGKSDNWAKLTGGESGIKTITRFPTDGLKTRIAGTIDYLPPQDRRPLPTTSRSGERRRIGRAKSLDSECQKISATRPPISGARPGHQRRPIAAANSSVVVGVGGNTK